MFTMVNCHFLNWSVFNLISNDKSQLIQEQVLNAYEQAMPLKITGGETKQFLGYRIEAENVDLSRHAGVVSYEPTELVITARAGTLLKDIEAILAEQNQMLAFEPPSFGAKATLGGTIACNLSGPRRAYQGAARDLVLGTRIVNGKGEVLSFGGEVMKNVAGYDLSRLMAGAMGTLGVLLDISLKVIPRPEVEATLSLSLPTRAAIEKIHQLSRLPLPISASAILDDTLSIRLSGAQEGVDAARQSIGGDIVTESNVFWQQLKEQQLGFFTALEADQSLWRLSLSSLTPELDIEGQTAYEWGGALRWLKTNEPAEKIRSLLNKLQGHGIIYSNSRAEQPFHALTPGLFKLHKSLKHSLDPKAILNPGRMYQDL
jgi:glycolate oxidase FAD binding subunit